jgi:hypothetical protein
VVTARVDLITDTDVWELKCTSKLSIEHLLQTVVYAWIWRVLYPDDTRNVKIFNIKTGEVLRVEASTEELTKIMVIMLKGKFGVMEKKDDKQFIEDCVKVYKKPLNGGIITRSRSRSYTM